MDAKIAARLHTIAREMEGFQEEGLFTDVVVNEELELAYADVKTAVARAHPSAVTPLRPPAPLVVSGPIGSRREETFEALLTEFPDTFGFPLVVTTRAPEENELDGVHYARGRRDVVPRWRRRVDFWSAPRSSSGTASGTTNSRRTPSR